MNGNKKDFQIFQKPKQVRNVLSEYRKFERSLGMQNVDLLSITQQIVKLSSNKNSNNDIPKKDLQLSINK